jgi:putative transcriptional regulator
MATGVDGLSIVDLVQGPVDGMSRVMIYSGYSGWGSGQLEAEIDEGSWYVVPAQPDDPFDDPGNMWPAVLRRQGGLLAVVSTYPLDPILN